jgi:hypothetical protein
MRLRQEMKKPRTLRGATAKRYSAFATPPVACFAIKHDRRRPEEQINSP